MTSFQINDNLNFSDQLMSFANLSNDILITHSNNINKIQSYQIYIRNIKKLLKNIDLKKNKNELIESLKQNLKENNNFLSNDNKKLKREVDYIQRIYNKKVEEGTKQINGLNFYLDKLIEDKFILENTLSSKNVYINLYNKTLKELQEEKIENPEERFMLYSKNISLEHKKELSDLQDELSKISKKHNKEILKTERLESELKTLRKELSETKNSIKTARNRGVNLMTDRFIFEKGIDSEEDEYNLTLLFNEFELEYSLDSFDDDSDINYDVDIDIDYDINENIVQKKQMPKINLGFGLPLKKNNNNLLNLKHDEREEGNLSNDRIKNNNLNEEKSNNVNKEDNNIKDNNNKSDKEVNVPSLNLKQIDYNKGKIVYNKKLFDEENSMEESIEEKIEKLKRDISRQIEKRKKYKNIIFKFEEYYKKTKQLIKDKAFLNNSVDDINFNNFKTYNTINGDSIVN